MGQTGRMREMRKTAENRRGFAVNAANRRKGQQAEKIRKMGPGRGYEWALQPAGAEQSCYGLLVW